MKVEAEELMKFARSLEGQVLETRSDRPKEFTVVVTDKGMEYTPLSTGKIRKQSSNYIDRICKQFSTTGSFRRSDYNYTAHASYILALIGKYVDR